MQQCKIVQDTWLLWHASCQSHLQLQWHPEVKVETVHKSNEEHTPGPDKDTLGGISVSRTAWW